MSVGAIMAAGKREALLVELFGGLIEERQKLTDRQVLGGNVWCGPGSVAVVERFVVLFEERCDPAQAYASVLVSGRLAVSSSPSAAEITRRARRVPSSSCRP